MEDNITQPELFPEKKKKSLTFPIILVSLS